MLFKLEHFAHFTDDFCNSLLAHSRNAANGVLLIHGVVANHFYDRSISNCIDAVETNLGNPDFLERLETYRSKEYERLTSVRSVHSRFVARFFDYYISRLPILFRPTINYNNKNLSLSSEDIERVSRRCFAQWASEYPDLVGKWKWSADYRKSVSHCRWFIPTSRREAHVYSMSWLWATLDALYPECMRETNTWQVTTHFLESCFPMFWDHLNGQYRRYLWYSAGLGLLVGNPERDTLQEKLYKKL